MRNLSIDYLKTDSGGFDGLSAYATVPPRIPRIGLSIGTRYLPLGRATVSDDFRLLFFQNR